VFAAARAKKAPAPIAGANATIAFVGRAIERLLKDFARKI
jgi:hypothetical protein